MWLDAIEDISERCRHPLRCARGQRAARSSRHASTARQSQWARARLPSSVLANCFVTPSNVVATKARSEDGDTRRGLHVGSPCDREPAGQRRRGGGSLARPGHQLWHVTAANTGRIAATRITASTRLCADSLNTSRAWRSKAANTNPSAATGAGIRRSPALEEPGAVRRFSPRHRSLQSLRQRMPHSYAGAMRYRESNAQMVSPQLSWHPLDLHVR